jgi:hypothetical protein
MPSAIAVQAYTVEKLVDYGAFSHQTYPQRTKIFRNHFAVGTQ